MGTHLHPGEPEAIIVLEGGLELHESTGVTGIGPCEGRVYPD